MKVIFVALLSLLSVTYVTCQSDDTCQSFRRFNDNLCDQLNTLKGAPGANGPPGPKGSSGASGACTCDLNKLEKQFHDLNQSFQAVSGLIQRNKDLLCGVGIRDGRVTDEDLTESSSWDADYRARYARLDNTGEPRSYWHAGKGHNKAGEWVQVDLKSPTRVTGITTQGRPNYDHWTASYKILYGNSDDDLQAIRDNDGDEMIFQGNTNRNTHMTNTFSQPITARYFRLVVVTFIHYPVLRMEYLTC